MVYLLRSKHKGGINNASNNRKSRNRLYGTFERHWNHSVQEVWSYLTENEKLAKWFIELHVDDLREGGVIKFDMQNGTFEELTILELKIPTVFGIYMGRRRRSFRVKSGN